MTNKILDGSIYSINLTSNIAFHALPLPRYPETRRSLVDLSTSADVSLHVLVCISSVPKVFGKHNVIQIEHIALVRVGGFRK